MSWTTHVGKQLRRRIITPLLLSRSMLRHEITGIKYKKSTYKTHTTRKCSSIAAVIVPKPTKYQGGHQGSLVPSRGGGTRRTATPSIGLFCRKGVHSYIFGFPFDRRLLFPRNNRWREGRVPSDNLYRLRHVRNYRGRIFWWWGEVWAGLFDDRLSSSSVETETSTHATRKITQLMRSLE